MRRVRELGIFEAEEICDLSLRGFRCPTCRTVGVLSMTGLRVPRLKYSGSLRLRKFGLSAGAVLRVPQAEGNWGSSRYLGVAALGDSVFLWVKGLVVPKLTRRELPSGRTRVPQSCRDLGLPSLEFEAVRLRVYEGFSGCVPVGLPAVLRRSELGGL